MASQELVDTNPQARALRQCTRELMKAICTADLLDVVWQLFEKELIELDVVEYCELQVTPSQKSSKIVSALIKTVSASPQLFESLVSVLTESGNTSLVRVGEKLNGLSQTLSCMTQQKQSEKAIALIRENELKLKDHFAQVQTSVYEKIQERINAEQINIGSFRVYMTTLFPPGEYIPDTKDACKIFTAITNNHLWDCLNYEPLNRVAKNYGGIDPGLETKLEAYTQAVVGYKLATKMSDHLSDVTVIESSDSEDIDKSLPSLLRKDQNFRRELTVKLDIPVGTQALKYVDELWDTVSKVFCLPSSSAILDKIIEGSLCITWLIPTLFVPQIMEIAKQPNVAEFFQKKKIIKVTVDGACLYEDHEQESSLGFAETAALKKSVDDTHSQYSHSYSESDLSQPQVTGYDVELEKDSYDLQCPICLLVLRDPMQVSCCGKRFCRPCIETIVFRAKPCPTCKRKSGHYDIFEDKGQKKTTLGKKVYCSNRKIGCGWIGELYQLNSHIRSCPQRQLYICPYCKHYSSNYLDVFRDHLPECEGFPVRCKVCSQKIPRKSLQHHQLECEKKKDPSQQYTATPLNFEIYSPVFISPPHFIMADFTKHKEKQMIWNSSPFYSHIGGYKMCLSVRAYGIAEGAGTHVSMFIVLMCGEYDNDLLWPFRGDITFQVVNQKRDEGHVEHTMTFDDRATDQYAGRVTEGEQSKGGWGHTTVIPHSALHYDQSLNTEYLKNDCLEFRVYRVKLSNTVEQLTSKTHNKYSSNSAKTKHPNLSPIPPVNMIMTNFISRKNSGSVWYSPPFYSHIGGYKFCLSVYANGLGNGTGTHVSVAVCLMHGEYDDNLKWPFRGDITFRLVNQRKVAELVDMNYHEHTVIFDDCTSELYAGRVTESERAQGKMCSLYTYPHSILPYCEAWNTEYLKDNSLEFRITQIKLTNSQQEQNEKVDALHIHEKMLEDHFFQLQMVVYEKIQRRLNAKEIKIIDVHVYMTALFPPGECIPKTSDISKIFTSITETHLWDYLNCQSLLRVAKMFGGKDPDLNAKLKVYTEKLSSYKMVTKMTDYFTTVTDRDNMPSHPAFRYDKHFRSELIVMFGTSSTIQLLSDIDDIWESLAKQFLLPPTSAIMDKVIGESSCITWLIPAFFVPKIMEMAEQPEVIQLLQNMNVEKATVNGAHIYGKEEEQENSFKSSINKDQEPSQKQGELAIATKSFHEEKVELMADLHQIQSPSVDGEEENERKLSFIAKSDITTKSFQEKRDDIAADREPPENTQESFLNVTEAATVKSVDDKPLSLPHLHPQQYPHPHSMPQQVTGYNVELVKESPDFRCSICLLVLRDPMQVNCCGKRFCQTCIKDIVVEEKPCPSCMCKAGDYDTFKDKGQEQRILEVRIYCENRKLGCGWSGELCQLDYHLNLEPKEEQQINRGCPYTKIKCIYCSEDCYRKHLRSCPQQPYSCQYCEHYSATYEAVYSHHLSDCDKFLVSSSLATPLKVATVSITSPVFVPPPNFIMANFTRHKEDEEPWYSSPFYSHIGGYKMCLKIVANGCGSDTGTNVSVFVRMIHGEFDSNLTWPFKGEITFQLVNQRRDEGHVEETLYATFYEHTLDKYAGRVIESKISVGWGSFRFIPHSALHYDESWNIEYLKNDCLEFRVSQVKLSETADRLLATAHEQQNRGTLRTEQLQPVSNIIISNFISHKTRGDALFSLPFYSHTGGYKMCLQMCANGAGNCTGTHVSVYVHLVHGEYDDSLVWPFRGDITLQLVNQKRNEGHMEHTIPYDDHTPDKCAGRVTESKISTGWGCPNFIPHYILHYMYDESGNTEYLKNDCLEIRVTNVKPITLITVTETI